MRPYITGSKPKEQRKLDFCVGAKICSGKAKDREEAERICALPKPVKPRSPRKREKSCEDNVLEITQCMMDYFESNKIYQQILNVNSVGTAIANALVKCTCQE